jgi:rhamnosyltransferase
VERKRVLVTVLMATYNGDRHIEAQLESLQNQTYSNWELIIRDDCSSDNTVNILKLFQKTDPRITILPSSENYGVVKNFSTLLKEVQDRNYIMFCDQDDLWLPNKIEESLGHFLSLEQKDKKRPLLLYTNLKYVTENLSTELGEVRIPIPENVFNFLIFQPFIYGCTMLFNKALLEHLGKIPEEAENHDYWTALTAAAYGTVIHLDKVTILYRQHSSNLSGSFDDNSITKRFRRYFLNWNSVHKLIDQRLAQIKAFHEQNRSTLSEKHSELICNLLRHCEIGGPGMVAFAIRNKLFKNGFFQTLICWLALTKSRQGP